MYCSDFKDFAYSVLKVILIVVVVVSFFAGVYYLINININFAYNISDALDIPRDLSLTVMSAGFVNNIIILMTVFEFGFGIWLFTKITNTKIYENIREIITNL